MSKDADVFATANDIAVTLSTVVGSAALKNMPAGTFVLIRAHLQDGEKRDWPTMFVSNRKGRAGSAPVTFWMRCEFTGSEPALLAQVQRPLKRPSSIKDRPSTMIRIKT